MIYKYNIITIYIYYTYTYSCIYNFTDYKIPASAEKKSLVSFKTESGSGVEEMAERRCRSHPCVYSEWTCWEYCPCTKVGGAIGPYVSSAGPQAWFLRTTLWIQQNIAETKVFQTKLGIL